MNPRGRGIGNWKARLAKVGCEVIDLNLIQDEIPPDLSLLIVAGPKGPFKPDELAKLSGYAIAGRPIMLLLGNTEPTGLDELLKSFNLAIGGGLVMDTRVIFNGNQALVFAPTSSAVKHPIVDPLGTNRFVLMPAAAPIHVFGQSPPGRPASEPVDPNLVPVPILLTSKYSWAESNPKNPPLRLDSEQDEPPPVLVGVAVSQRPEKARPGDAAEGKPRLVLFSSPAMAENAFHEIEPTNLDLLMNAASWLRNRPDTQGIPAHTHVAVTLPADPFLRSRLIPSPVGRGRDVDRCNGNYCLYRPASIMKIYLKTYVLMVVFFGGLLALWWLGHAGIRTENERRLRETRILPDLIEVPELGVRKVAIERGKDRLVFERRGHGVGRWQMVEPTDVAAEPTRLETLVRNLKELRRSLDSGIVAGPADTFGLAPPVATVSLWGESPSEASKPGGPIATLALGKTVRRSRYVRPGGTDNIEVADSKLLSAVDLPVPDWRAETRLSMGVPTFQVASVTIKRPEREIRGPCATTGGDGT